jgi:hypothetical protein
MTDSSDFQDSALDFSEAARDMNSVNTVQEFRKIWDKDTRLFFVFKSAILNKGRKSCFDSSPSVFQNLTLIVLVLPLRGMDCYG